MIKDPKYHIDFIEKCIVLIDDYLDESTLEQFKEGGKLQDCVVMRLIAIGAEIGKLSKMSDDRSDLDLKNILNSAHGIRRHVVSPYTQLNIDAIWDIIKDVNPIKTGVRKL